VVVNVAVHPARLSDVAIFWMVGDNEGGVWVFRFCIASGFDVRTKQDYIIPSKRSSQYRQRITPLARGCQ